MSKTAYLVSKWLSRDLSPGGLTLRNPHASRTFERDQCKRSLFVPSLQSLPAEGERNPFWSAPGSRLMTPVSPTFLPWDSAAGCFSLLLFSFLHLHNHYLITWWFFFLLTMHFPGRAHLTFRVEQVRLRTFGRRGNWEVGVGQPCDHGGPRANSRAPLWCGT